MSIVKIIVKYTIFFINIISKLLGSRIRQHHKSNKNQNCANWFYVFQIFNSDSSQKIQTTRFRSEHRKNESIRGHLRSFPGAAAKTSGLRGTAEGYGLPTAFEDCNSCQSRRGRWEHSAIEIIH